VIEFESHSPFTLCFLSVLFLSYILGFFFFGLFFINVQGFFFVICECEGGGGEYLLFILFYLSLDIK
jgi:hypothetical protein